MPWAVPSRIALSLPIMNTKPQADDARPGRAPAGGQRRMIDSHGRTIRDLRLSITDRCNFRCVYCMDPGVRFMPSEELLQPWEMARLAGLCVGLGVEKVRITGGEPTLHPALEEIIRGVAATGVGDIAMTTNGWRIGGDECRAWKAAGLTRLTVSIDSLNEEKFSTLTRSSTGAADVVRSIDCARGAGFDRVKANAVVVRGLNEDEVPALAGLARTLGIEMRFIEYMPLDSGRAWEPGLLVPAAEIIERINAVTPLREVGRDEPSSTALVYEFADGAPGRIGVIAPVTAPFCGACARLRITADGKVRPCLFSLKEWDLRPLLRGGAGDREIEEFLIDVTWTKQAGHGISAPGFEQPARSMSAIGG